MDLTNFSKEKLFIRATFLILNGKGASTHRVQVKKVLAPTRESPSFSFGDEIFETATMAVDEFIKKDVLYNKMEELLDQGGRLNIHLKMSCKGKECLLRIYAKSYDFAT